MPRPQADAAEAGDRIVQRRVPAAGMPAPATTGPRSVFDIACAPKAAAKNAAPAAVPAAELTIRRGVPMPRVLGRSGGMYLPVILQMQVGDSVELPAWKAKSFMARCKEFAKTCQPPRHFAVRKLSATHSGVWRDA